MQHPFPAGPAAPAHPPDPDLLTPRRTVRALIGILAGLALTIAATFLLPDDRYIRHQQASDSVMVHARWIYERVRFDRTPIDVAVVGDSRLEAGLSPAVLSREVSRIARRPIHVANLSLVRAGRDYSWETVRDLLAAHPEVRLILLADHGSSLFSHPMFKATADARDIVGAPLLINIKYPENLLYLPYRNVDYATQTLFPHAFGVAPRFDRHAYAGAGLDRTLGYRAPTGDLVNGDRHAAVATLRAQADAMLAGDASGSARWLRRLPPEIGQPGERVYVRAIAALARANGTRLMFVTLPMFGGAQVPTDDAFLARFGPIVALPDLARHPEDYANGGHLNRAGAVAASRALAPRIAALLSGAPWEPIRHAG